MDEKINSEEFKRIETLYSYEILDTPAEEDLEDITKLASIICDTPICIISLLDKNRVWFKSKIGLGISELDRKLSFCRFAVMDEFLFEVEDPTKDERFKENPLVNCEGGLRFYAGIPLKSPNGYKMGTLCVLDYSPKKLNDKQVLALTTLGKQVMQYFELRKKNKELIHLNIKAEKLGRAKDEFLSNVSHELRTPLNAVYGFTNLLYNTKLNEEQIEYISIIKNSVEILISLINDILDYSKIEAGKLKIFNQPFNIKLLMNNISQLFQLKASEKKLQFIISIDNNIPDLIIGDKVRLNQVMVNLIGNAIKFTRKGNISVNCKIVNETSTDIELILSVIDTGIGIPEDKIDKIFERFEQATEDTYIKYGGTGLGLSICKNILELQNSNLNIKSTYGEGSEFNFKIKYKKLNESDLKMVESEENKQSPDLNLKNLQILLCEDTIFNVRLIKKILDPLGVKLEVAENGLICLDKLKNNKYDCILMDINMPVMDGFTTTNMIRENLKIDIPIIALTANNCENEKKKCLKIGMNSYLSKPFKQEELIGIIKKFISKKSNNVIKIMKSPIRSILKISPKMISTFKNNKNSYIKKNVIQLSNKKIIKLKSPLINNEKISKENNLLMSKDSKYSFNMNRMNSLFTISPKTSIINLKFNNKDKLFKKDDININKRKNSKTKIALTKNLKTLKDLIAVEPNIKETKKFFDYEKINQNILEDYSGGDECLEKELIEVFLNDFPKLLKTLEESIYKKDFDEIKNISHKMKTSLLYFGLNNQHKYLLDIEEYSKKQDIVSIKKNFKDLKSNIQINFTELTDFLKRK